MLRFVDAVACLSTSFTDWHTTSESAQWWADNELGEPTPSNVIPSSTEWFYHHGILIELRWRCGQFSLDGALCSLSEKSVVCFIHSHVHDEHVRISKRISLKPPWILIVLVEKSARYWRTWVDPDFPVQWTHFCFAETHRTKWTQNRTFGFCKSYQWFLCVYVTISDDHLSNLNSLRNQIQNDAINRQT